MQRNAVVMQTDTKKYYFSPRAFYNLYLMRQVHNTFFRVRPAFRINRVETKTCSSEKAGLLES